MYWRLDVVMFCSSFYSACLAPLKEVRVRFEASQILSDRKPVLTRSQQDYLQFTAGAFKTRSPNVSMKGLYSVLYMD